MGRFVAWHFASGAAASRSCTQNSCGLLRREPWLDSATPPTNALAAECPRRPPSLPPMLDLHCYASAAAADARFAVSRSPNLGTGPGGRWLLGALGFGQSGLCENLHYKPKEYPSALEAAVLTLKEQPQWHENIRQPASPLGPRFRRQAPRLRRAAKATWGLTARRGRAIPLPCRQRPHHDFPVKSPYTAVRQCPTGRFAMVPVPRDGGVDGPWSGRALPDLQQRLHVA